MNIRELKKEVKGYSAMDLTLEYNRLLFLAEYDDPPSISLAVAKKLLYVEEELENRKNKYLPGLPKVELKAGSDSEQINKILGSYYKRKSISKLDPADRLRFYVEVKNDMNSTIASIPVMAVNKDEALILAREKSTKFGYKNLRFKVC